jgi:hypothetical protein
MQFTGRIGRARAARLSHFAHKAHSLLGLYGSLRLAEGRLCRLNRRPRRRRPSLQVLTG